MATLSLTPDPSAEPPSVLVEVAGDAGQIISSIELTRDGVPVIGSPLAGFSQATYTDYTAPYGVPCSYRAVGVASAQGWASIWSESWSSLSSWSGSGWTTTASHAVSGETGSALVREAVNFGKLTVSSPQYVRVELLTATDAIAATIACTTSIVISGTSTTSIPLVESFAAWIIGSVLHVETASGAASVTVAGTVAKVRLVAIPNATESNSWVIEPSQINDAAAYGGFVYVLTPTAIIKYDTSGAVQTSWNTPTIAYTASIDADDSGVYLLQWNGGSSTYHIYVTKYNTSGSIVTQWDFTITGAGGGKSSISLDSSYVYVATQFDGMMRKFTKSGSLSTSWTSGAMMSMCVGPSGNVFIAASSNYLVKEYSTTGTLIRTWYAPVFANSIASDGISLFMAGFVDTTVYKYTGTGVLVSSWNASPVRALASDGSIYSASGSAKTVTKWDWSQASVGAIETLHPSGTSDENFDVTAGVVLDSSGAWLIHPKSPALSIPVAFDGSVDGLNLSADGSKDVVREAQATRQRAAGATSDAVFTVGDRADGGYTLSGVTFTSGSAAAVRAIIVDENSLLLRFPPSWDSPLEERWLSVGDVTETILPGSDIRKWALPVTPSAIPYVIVEPVWSEAALVVAYATEASMVAAYATEYDKLVNHAR